MRLRDYNQCMVTSPRPLKPTLSRLQIAALLLALFSFAMSAILSRTVFERLPHLEDEVAYLFQARTLARGDAAIESPQPERAFWQPFVVDHEGLRFSKYTPGWPALLAVGEAVGSHWLINASLAALTTALIFRLGAAVYSQSVGLIGAALAAFSPMALLLNATLMGHTAALFAGTLFLYAYWRLEHAQHRRLRWGVVAGLALGGLIAARPMSALAIALPLMAWSAIRLWRARKAALLPTLRPLLALSAVALLISLCIPIYNHAATGSATQNLYTLVWSYDRVGYGEGYGRNTHTLEKGIRHTRYDLSLMAADLFGWQLQPLTPELLAHLQTESDYWPATGVSWILLPLGLLVIYRRRAWWTALWFAALIAWVSLPGALLDGQLSRDPRFAWAWLLLGIAGLLLPLTRLRGRGAWTWLLVSTALMLIAVQLAYWIGSQRYSTRYYFEGLSALALISALPLAWLAEQRVGGRSLRSWLYGGLALILGVTLFAYSLPRIDVLRGYNLITRAQIAEVEARRSGDQPVLVLVTGTDVRWRAYGALTALTSPYLDSPIVVAWVYDESVRDQIAAQFPDRQIIEMAAEGNRAWFVDGPPAANGE